jgi:hypothetical protein
MSDTYLQLTPPNTCALIYAGTKITYVATEYSAKIWPFDGYTDFEQFVLPEDAAVRALEIDPDFDTTCILGPLTLNPVNVSNPQEEAVSGYDLTLYSEYSCPDSILTYQWIDANGEDLPGETANSITFSNISRDEAGIYACNVTAVNVKGQRGNYQSAFTVIVVPALTNSDVAG